VTVWAQRPPYIPHSPHPEEVTAVTVSKDEDVSRDHWNLLRDAAPRLLRMRID
jgi:hypothetical protein